MAYRTGRETVGLFRDATAFQDAVDDLLLRGFDRSLLSLVAHEAAVGRALGHLFDHSHTAADDPAIPRIPFVGMRSRSVMRTMAVSTLASVGVCAVAGGVVASGGTVVLAFAAGAAVGGASGALGVAAGRIMQRRHARHLLWQLERGGILLWVTTPTAELESVATEILQRHGADHVHAHDVTAGEAPSIDGVSDSLAWINKPLPWLSHAPVRSRGERGSTLH